LLFFKVPPFCGDPVSSFVSSPHCLFYVGSTVCLFFLPPFPPQIVLRLYGSVEISALLVLTVTCPLFPSFPLSIRSAHSLSTGPPSFFVSRGVNFRTPLQKVQVRFFLLFLNVPASFTTSSDPSHRHRSRPSFSSPLYVPCCWCLDRAAQTAGSFVFFRMAPPCPCFPPILFHRRTVFLVCFFPPVRFFKGSRLRRPFDWSTRGVCTHFPPLFAIPTPHQEGDWR